MAWLADAVLTLHVGVVAFVVLGTVLILLGGWRQWRWVRGFRWRLAHLALMAFIVVQTVLGRLCPLTLLEQRLRQRAGQPAYAESFVAHWLARLIFFHAPWRAFLVAYVGFATLVIVAWFKVPPQRRRRRAGTSR